MTFHNLHVNRNVDCDLDVALVSGGKIFHLSYFTEPGAVVADQALLCHSMDHFVYPFTYHSLSLCLSMSLFLTLILLISLAPLPL